MFDKEEAIAWLGIQLVFLTWILFFRGLRMLHISPEIAFLFVTPASVALCEPYDTFARWYYR